MTVRRNAPLLFWLLCAAPLAGQGITTTKPNMTAAVTSHLLRFWDQKGSPVAMVQYEAAVQDLPAGPVGMQTLHVSLYMIGDSGQMRDSSWTHGFDADRTDAHYASGFVIVPLPAWARHWSLHVGTPGWSRRMPGNTTDSTLPLPEGQIVISDIANGVPHKGDVWEFGDQKVMVDLAGAFPKKSVVHLYFQVRSMERHDEVRTYMTLTDVSNPKSGKRVMQANYTGDLNAGINYFDRELDLAHVKSGKYLLEVQVGDTHGGGTAVRMATFVVR